jgi:DNA-binding IclR family transcriptional regulator
MAKGKNKTPKTPKTAKNAVLLNDPNERKKLKTALATITHHFQAIDDQKEAIKETIEEVSSTSGLEKKTIRKLATTMYKHNYASLQEENRHFESLYEVVVEGRLLTNNDPLDNKDDVDGLEQEQE